MGENRFALYSWIDHLFSVAIGQEQLRACYVKGFGTTHADQSLIARHRPSRQGTDLFPIQAATNHVFSVICLVCGRSRQSMSHLDVIGITRIVDSIELVTHKDISLSLVRVNHVHLFDGRVLALVDGVHYRIERSEA